MKQPLRETIASALRSAPPDTFLSGDELASRYGVSRAAVWKQIEELRRQGYRIEAVPRRGYRLQAAPDRLTPGAVQAELERLGPAPGGQGLRWTVQFYDQVESTNDLAGTLAGDGAPEGTVVAAETQMRGRGRLGRMWHSVPGGIWLSLILRPPLPPAAAASVTLVAAVAVADAVERATGIQVGIKWPNDLLIDSRKVCGILTEVSAELDRVNYLILGIGLNANQQAADFPSDVARRAMSLRIASGRAVDRVRLCAWMLRQIDLWYGIYLREGFAPVRSAWRERSATLGREVVASGPDGRIAGTAVDLDADGALLVRDAAGTTHRVGGGEITLREDVPPC